MNIIMDCWEKYSYLFSTLSVKSTVHNSLSSIKRITPNYFSLHSVPFANAFLLKSAGLVSF